MFQSNWHFIGLLFCELLLDKIFHFWTSLVIENRTAWATFAIFFFCFFILFYFFVKHGKNLTQATLRETSFTTFVLHVLHVLLVLCKLGLCRIALNI